MRDLMLRDHGWVRKLYDNSHEIAPGVWRSFQPSPAALKKWADKGIKTVVNLRGDKPSPYLFLEQEACDALDINLVSLRLFSREAPAPETLHGAHELFRSITYPALFHCKSGADRAGLMATLYLFLHGGKPLDEALQQLSFRYGHVRQGKTGVIDRAFDLYLEHAKQHGVSLSDTEAFFAWIDSDAYDPAAIKRDFLSSWWGNFLTERLLRRE